MQPLLCKERSSTPKIFKTAIKKLAGLGPEKMQKLVESGCIVLDLQYKGIEVQSKLLKLLNVN